MKKPATLGLRGAKTRFDEFQSIHQLQAYSTHFVVSTYSGYKTTTGNTDLSTKLGLLSALPQTDVACT